MEAPHDDERHLAWLHAHRRTPTVTVYYDPDAPQRAVLVREVDPFWLMRLPLALVYGCLIILLPILFFGFLWRRLLR